MNGLIKMKSIANQLNDLTFTDWYYRIMMIARSVFEYEGLPNGIKQEWIERYLFTDGQCVFFNDPEKGFMVAKVTPNGNLNHYDEPTIVRPFGTAYMGEPLENNVDCVVIKNNDIMRPTSPTVQLYALKLANIDRTIDTNIHAQKMPLIIKCTEKQKTSLKQVISKRNENEPVIFASKELDTEGIEVLNTQAPIVFKDLELEKHMVWNEVMTFLGINNANMDKKERLVDDEVQANNEQVEASFNVMLKAREQAVEQINKLFGLKIKVKKRIQNMPPMDSKGSETEGVNDSEGGVA